MFLYYDIRAYHQRHRPQSSGWTAHQCVIEYISTSVRVIGYIFLLNGVVVTWRSRSQKTVTLSVTESEYSEITEVCFKILFFRAILLFMGVVVEYLVNVHVDNIGAIFLLDNTSVSQRTKHIDVHHQFICDYGEDKAVGIKFFCSEENLADQITNNLSNG